MPRFLSFLVGATLLLVGLSVPLPAHAAEPAPSAIPSKVFLEPEPTVARLSPTLKLTLTMATYLHDGNGQPVAGGTVDFTLLAKAPSIYEEPKVALPVCSAVSDASGLATCQGNVSALIGSVVSILAGGAYATLIRYPFPSETEFTKLPVVLSN